MYRPNQMYRNPWYRGYMPRSYIAPHFIASFGCSIYLIVFGVFLLLGGTIATVMSKHITAVTKAHDEDPRFQDEFFKQHRNKNKGFETNITGIMHTIGIVFISLGSILIISAIVICCFARHYIKKQEKKRENTAAQPLSEGPQHAYPPPPPGSYPQQMAPPPGSYPQQPAPPPGSYPQQPAPPAGSYPQQPAYYPQQSAAPGSYPYPSSVEKPLMEDDKPPQYQPPYPESQIPNTNNAPPIGFKEG